MDDWRLIICMVFILSLILRNYDYHSRLASLERMLELVVRRHGQEAEPEFQATQVASKQKARRDMWLLCCHVTIGAAAGAGLMATENWVMADGWLSILIGGLIGSVVGALICENRVNHRRSV